MLAAGELPIKEAPLLAVSRMSGGGHEHVLLPAAAVPASEFRKTFTSHAHPKL